MFNFLVASATAIVLSCQTTHWDYMLCDFTSGCDNNEVQQFTLDMERQTGEAALSNIYYDQKGVERHSIEDFLITPNYVEISDFGIKIDRKTLEFKQNRRSGKCELIKPDMETQF